LGVDRHAADLARANGPQERSQRRKVEVVAHVLAPGLGKDWKVRILPRDLQQAGAAHALLPERGALAWPSLRQQQRARRILPKTGREERRGGKLRGHQRLNLFGIEDQIVERGRSLYLRQMHRDAVVRPQRTRIHSEGLLEVRLECEGERGV